MVIFYFVVGILIGGFSAFNIFALGFNGSSWLYLAIISLSIALGSGLVGRFLQSWKVIISGFFLPHLLLYALLIMGSLEKGMWLGNLGLIAITSFAIWVPALVSRNLVR
jgi:hypothetical protein